MDQKKLRIRLIVLQLVSFAAFASMNYYTILLQTTGFTASQVGLWSSVGCIVAIVALPVWGIISDRTGNIRGTFVLSMVIYAALFLIFPGTAALWKRGMVLPIYAAIAGYYLVKQPTHSLQDAWFISVGEPRGIAYAGLRMWGSLGFGVVAVLTGILAEHFSIDLIFYMPLFFVAIMLFLIRGVKEDAPAGDTRAQSAQKSSRKADYSGLFKNYYWLTALLAVFSLAFYTAATSAFYGFILEHAGVDPASFGLFSGYGAILQCVVIFIINRLEQKIPRPYILIAGGMFAVCENLLYSVAHGMPMMFVCATLWAVEVSVNVSTLPKYVYTIVPREHQATAQTISGTCCMVLSVLGGYFGGRIVDSLGIVGFNRIVAGLTFAFTALFALSLLIGVKVLKKPAPWVIAEALPKT